MLTAHTTAVRSRLSGHPKLAGKVEDVVRRDAAGALIRANYLILGVNLPGYTEARLTATATADGDADLEVYVRVVAVDVDGVNLLTDAVAEQMQGHVLTISGRTLTPLNRVELEPIAYDRPTNLFHRDAWFEATTSRA